jgi:tagatose 1,6-diphosphate aldolase GatY/KbaY
VRALGPGVIVDAQHRGEAIAGLSTYTTESTAAICAAATHTGRDVLIQISAGAFDAETLPIVVSAALAGADRASVRIGVHLDHAHSLDEVRAGLDAGVTSVMVDGSALAYDDNVELTRAVVAAVREVGGFVEAELGEISGDEDASVAAAPGAGTDPELAGAFVRATDVDLLAAAVGTVHGMATAPAHLEIDRIRAIVAATHVPFCLHGGSGLSPAELQGAIRAGTAKVNINTEIRRAYLAALPTAPVAGDDVTAVMRETIAAMTAVCERAIHALESTPARN